MHTIPMGKKKAKPCSPPASAIHLLDSLGEGCEDQGFWILFLEVFAEVELSSAPAAFTVTEIPAM
jgi:hypothetical protein